jgi:hypothetical protein
MPGMFHQPDAEDGFLMAGCALMGRGRDYAGQGGLFLISGPAVGDRHMP